MTVPVVDLGCGGSKRGDIGIDMYPYPGVDIVCHLGFEPIPLADNSVDKVLAYDFLEHLPVSAYYRENGKWQVHRPRIYLLREVYRILKPGGRFESFTPNFPHQQWAQDPTHEGPPWCPNSWFYFTNPNMPKSYGIDFAFKMVSGEERGTHLFVVVEKP